MSDVRQRMAEVLSLVDNQMLMCDDEDEMLMVACALMQRTFETFEQVLGPVGRKKMFMDAAGR